MSAFGRGGRGQALLRALAQPVRRPGEPPAEQQPQEQNGSLSTDLPVGDDDSGSFSPPPLQAASPPGEAETTPTTPVMKPFGRGLTRTMLAKLAESAPQESKPPGRGTPTQQQRESKPVGSGRAALLTQQPTAVRAPATPRGGHVSPQKPQSGLTPVTPMGMSKMESSMSGLSVSSPPMTGTSGAQIPLSGNFIRLKSSTEGVYQYNVSFNPMIDSKNMRYSMLSAQQDLIGTTRVFDGATLYLPKKITEGTVTCTAVRKTDDTTVTLSITLVAVVHHANCIQLFNVLFRRVLRELELKQVGRHYYDPHSPIAIPQHKMELWPGYVSAIQEHDGGLLLLFDVSHRLLRTDSALDFLYELYSKNKNRFQEAATKQLVGVVVLTRYNNRTYRIDDIAWDKNPQSTFIDHSGEPVSFIDYYKRAYGKEITDIDQPLLIHRPRRRVRDTDAPEEVICLVPELCCMTGLTDYARSDFKVMKDLATHTRIQPHQRQQIVRKFVDKVNKTPKAKDILQSWGLTINPVMIEFSGRALQPEKILFKKNAILAGMDADWGRDAVKENVITAVALRNWILVVTKRDSAKAMDFLNMMRKVGPPMGIEVSDAKVLEVPNDRTETYLQAIRPEIGGHLQLVVIVFPTSRDDRYAAIKKLCCVEQPVPSQVINARTISQQQKLRSVTQKIALQINCKLGGELWALEIPLKNLMVIGIDVYHDSVLGQKRSITGFVASTNRHLTRWYSRVAIQNPKQEIVDGLKMCLTDALKKYHQVNKVLPDRIIVYRDGVGDGQMQTVSQYEVPQMESCFSLFGDTYKPKLTTVVVQKRILARIFHRGGQTGLGNPPPGTLVDHTITRKGWYDFFLVSQHVRQGTVSPTHYNVVYDTGELKPDHMQRLTYKMTHMYYNWPGTIRVPAPCQYAHKLAYLVGQSIHQEPDRSLSDRLFFL